MSKLYNMIKNITMPEVFQAEELLVDAMYEAGLSGQIPVTMPAAFLFCLGKRVGIHEERSRRKGGRKHD